MEEGTRGEFVAVHLPAPGCHRGERYEGHRIRYVVIDNCWHGSHDSQGFIHEDRAKFPSGLKALRDYIHEHGLKFGIYSNSGRKTCGGRPGSQGHEYQEAQIYAHGASTI